MNPYLKAVILISAFTILISCNKTPTEIEPTYEPGKRDYKWTADTIKANFIYFNSLWGKTATDVWVVSLVGSALESIYRYDGTKWYRETRTPIGNTVSLWGTENNLWISTHDVYIWNYKKNIFTSSPHFLYEGVDIDFFSIAGKNDNEVLACGFKRVPYSRDGIIYRYNGNNWQLDKIIKNNGAITRVRYSSINNRYYIQTFIDNETKSDTVKLYEYNGNEFKVIYQNYVSENTDCIINDINGYIYVTIGKKIYKYYKDSFEKVLEVNNPNFGGQVWGRNKNDLFIRMFDGIMHYNGTDLQYVLKFPIDIRFGTSALILEKDVFLHAIDNKTGYNIIYHGRLQ